MFAYGLNLPSPTKAAPAIDLDLRKAAPGRAISASSGPFFLGSTYSSNEEPRDRQVSVFFFGGGHADHLWTLLRGVRSVVTGKFQASDVQSPQKRARLLSPLTAVISGFSQANLEPPPPPQARWKLHAPLDAPPTRAGRRQYHHRASRRGTVH